MSFIGFDFSCDKIILQRFFYPEQVVLFGIVGYLATLNLSSIYSVILAILLFASGIILSISLLRERSFVLDIANIALLALTLGVLQLNFIPSICLWLLLFQRLLFTHKDHIIPFILLVMVLFGLTLFVVKATLFQMELTTTEQNFLNNFSFLLAIISFGAQSYRLIYRIQYYQQQLAERKQRMDILISVTNKLTRFIPPQIWQPIIRSNQSIAVTNQRKKLTILFSDIVGFTELSDNLSSDHLADILNTYLDRMTQIANKYGATLDKFVGDGMLCYFGDHNSQGEKNDALLCAKMAIDMRREMRVLRHQWRLLGFEGLYIRIGINTGYCHVGNFGSRNRMAYTVIGKEANLASRLEAAAEKNQILISASTFDLICHENNCVLAGSYRLKGFKEPVFVWELRDPEEDKVNETDWIEYDLPGFNLHLNFKDIRNYDERSIRNYLNYALEQLDKKQKQ